MLDKRPDLTSRLRKVANVDQGESRKSLVEGTAESIQRAFTMCLTERSSNRNGVGKDGKPEGKKIGIYSFANLVLKLLFQVCLHSASRESILTTYSVRRLAWLTSSLPTFPNTLLRWRSILLASELHTFTISGVSSSRTITSTALSSV